MRQAVKSAKHMYRKGEVWNESAAFSPNSSSVMVILSQFEQVAISDELFSNNTRDRLTFCDSLSCHLFPLLALS